MSKIIRFEDLKNKKFEKRHIIYIIFAVIVIYIFYSIFLLVRKPTDTVTINSGVVTLEESATGYIIGAVILFGASGLLAWLQNTVSKVIE